MTRLKKYLDFQFHLNSKGLLFLKLVVFIILICLGLFIFNIHTPGFYYTLVIQFLMAILWIFILHKKAITETNLSMIQIIVDTSLANILIQYSGGLESPLIFLLILDIFLGAYILPRKKLFIIGCYICIFYAVFSTLSYLDLLPNALSSRYPIQPSAEVYFYYVIYLRVFLFFMIGYLASILSGRLYTQQALLHAIEERTKIILDQVDVGFISVNLDGRINYANNAALKIIEKDSSQIGNLLWTDLFLEHQISSNRHQIFSLAYSKEGAEFQIEKKDGTKIDLSLTISDLIDNETNKITGKILVFKDMTLFKEMQHLKAQQKKLKTFGELSSALAHEIKNPLASICGSLEVLKENHTFENISARKMVDIILKESERLGRTLSEFLTFSGGVPLNQKIIDLNTPVNETVLLMQNHREIGKNIKIHAELSAEQLTANVDEDYFKQMLFNMILNAAQAIENQGEVIVQLEQKGDNAHLIIEDNGKGIPDSIKRDIFQPFFTTRSKGIGLGLNVCQKVIQKHGWKLKYKPQQEGTGTVFTIIIPLAINPK